MDMIPGGCNRMTVNRCMRTHRSDFRLAASEHEANENEQREGNGEYKKLFVSTENREN
jgi:hypothetical protein